MIVLSQRPARSPLICLQCPINSTSLPLVLQPWPICFFFLKVKIQTSEPSNLGMMALDWASDKSLFDAACKTSLSTRCLYKSGPSLEAWHQRMLGVIHLIHNEDMLNMSEDRLPLLYPWLQSQLYLQLWRAAFSYVNKLNPLVTYLER